MFTRRTTKRTLVGTLTASILLHAVVFGTLRLKNPNVVQVPAPPQVLEILEITERPDAPEAPDAAGSRPDPGSVDAPQNASSAAPQPQSTLAVLLADLKAEMRPVTALRTVALAVDDHQIRFDHPSAADTILASPYPFAQLGGVRVGVGMGGGNCPAPTFP